MGVLSLSHGEIKGKSHSSHLKFMIKLFACQWQSMIKPSDSQDKLWAITKKSRAGGQYEKSLPIQYQDTVKLLAGYGHFKVKSWSTHVQI